MGKFRAFLLFAVVSLGCALVAYVFVSESGLPVICVDNAAGLAVFKELVGNSNAVYCLDWSPGGDYLVSGSQDGTVIVWDTGDWAEASRINAYRGSVWGVSYSPDGGLLATAGAVGGVRLWDAGDYGEVDGFVGQPFWGFSVSWVPDGSCFVAGYSNGDVIKYGLGDGEVFFGEHLREVVAVDISPDGARVATGSIDYKINIWDVNSGTLLSTLIADTLMRNDINGLEWSPDGVYLAAACQDGYIRVWDIETGEVTAQSGSPYGGWKRGVAWSPDGSILAYSGEDCKVVLWDVEEDTILVELKHDSPVWDVAWSPCGRYIASGSGFYGGSGDTRVNIWAVS